MAPGVFGLPLSFLQFCLPLQTKRKAKMCNQNVARTAFVFFLVATGNSPQGAGIVFGGTTKTSGLDFGLDFDLDSWLETWEEKQHAVGSISAWLVSIKPDYLLTYYKCRCEWKEMLSLW